MPPVGIAPSSTVRLGKCHYYGHLPRRRARVDPLAAAVHWQSMNVTRKSRRARLRRKIWDDRYLYLMISPVIAYYLIFHYAPMYGTIIAFKDFSPGKGIVGST